MKHPEETWLALAIGNSRLHWAKFAGNTLQATWDSDHLSTEALKQLSTETKETEGTTDNLSAISVTSSVASLYLASVVPEQTAIWQTYPDVRLITLEQIPLLGTYPTLGIDRALAVWGAGQTYGFPILVIDAGTALTFTGADANNRLVGGAILPGLRSQLRSLASNTAALPEVELPAQMPPRWALNTPDAIQSGTIYTLVAGIKDFVTAWCQEFPGSKVVITGGDRSYLLNYLQTYSSQIAAEVIDDPHLIFWGMRSLVIKN